MLVCCEHGSFRRRERRVSKRADADQLRHALRLPKHGRSALGKRVEDHVLSYERVAGEGLLGAINNVTALRSKNAAMLNKHPVRRWQSRQWHIEARVGPPWHPSRSLPQVQLAKRSVTRHKLHLVSPRAARLGGKASVSISHRPARSLNVRVVLIPPLPWPQREPVRLDALTSWRSKLECPKRRTG